MTFSIPSKYATRCPLCQQPIGLGDPVTKKGTKWVHAPNCPDGAGVSVFAQTMLVAQAKPVETKPERPFVPSPYQAAIFEWIVFGQGHCVVEACAGSGKTTTSVQAVKYLPLWQALKTGKVANDKARDIFETSDPRLIAPYEPLMSGLDVGFFAFNKHIADELRSRLPAWCKASTLHSKGYSDLKAVLGKIEIDEDKRWEMLYGPYWDLRAPRRWYDLSSEHRTELRNRRNSFRKFVGLSKASLVAASDPEAVRGMIAHYGLDLEENESRFIEILPQVLQVSQESLSIIDFDDMQWLPVSLNLPLKKYDVLFVDECQDLNECQAEFILRSIKPDGRIVAIGDRNQSIYGFRGANADAIPNLIESLHAATLPLSITYRCPTSHVALAQAIVPHIQARDNAPVGRVADIPKDSLPGLIEVGDMIICRTNAPLVPVAFMLIRRGIKATIRGKDIGKSLADLAERLAYGCPDMGAFNYQLNAWSTAEINKLEARNAAQTQIQAIIDRTSTLSAVAAECDTPQQVSQRVEEIFSDQNGEIVLSSVHRAKGLESKTVWILAPEQMPFPKAELAWEVQQEWNIKYIALTRSMENLFFVRS